MNQPVDRKLPDGADRSGSTDNAGHDGFFLNTSAGYFQNNGVDVMAFDDIYPEGHQSGVSMILHGRRIATNGDIRFEPTPGQWQPVPKQLERVLDEESQTVTTTLCFPDPERHLVGFNPMIYPDFEFSYQVAVKAQGKAVVVTVDLDREVPAEFVGKLSFNLELFPGALFGKPWIMDGKHGIFPRQANGPVAMRPSNSAHPVKKKLSRQAQETVYGAGEEFLDIGNDQITADMEHLLGDRKTYNPIAADDLIAEPYARGHKITVCPDDPYTRFSVESRGAELLLYDGRMNHNNGWFVLSSEVPGGRTQGVIQWVITPNAVKGWRYEPVVQVSQVGYHPDQPKVAVIELDGRPDPENKQLNTDVILYEIAEDGPAEVYRAPGERWGKFLRYQYLKFDFSAVRKEGLYRVDYGQSRSAVFRIAPDLYERGVWQPVLEYFLPVQMCHMRVNEKYRVWHGHCHRDDARMAAVNRRHFDGYLQGESTLTKWKPGDFVPGLDVGGWHDAGDFDLRVESQSGEAYILALAYEEFGVEYDATTVDQQAHLVEIHQPDGKNDILQQIEHGVLAVTAGYQSLGRLYRGIIANSLRQYVLLGDASTMTEGIAGDGDDRWVFTEDNPQRELTVAAHLAACARALRDFHKELAAECRQIAEALYEETRGGETPEGGRAEAALFEARAHAAAELYLTTEAERYGRFFLENQKAILARIHHLGWLAVRVERKLKSAAFSESLRKALPMLQAEFEARSGETPYGIPYRPRVWGAGWGIQALAFRYYFLNRADPKLFGPDLLFQALHFVLGCHPGSNTASFASGVGARSMTAAYGANRADWSFIPGGVCSGTALIRPDFPELLEFPFLWQQAEYVLGGGSSHYLFLVLAVRELLGKGRQGVCSDNTMAF